MATSLGAKRGWIYRKLGLSPADRFWNYFDRSDPSICWIWPGNAFPTGYGQITVARRNRPTHRFAWEITNGPIPIGLNVCHKCDIKLCCNPSHLFLGTQKDNCKDAINKGRWANKKGEHHALSKLTTKAVLKIRKLYASEQITQKELAIKFKVQPSAISKIIIRSRWKHI